MAFKNKELKYLHFNQDYKFFHLSELLSIFISQIIHHIFKKLILKINKINLINLFFLLK